MTLRISSGLELLPSLGCNMGILRDQAFRLQRQENWTAQELSEELFLMFRSKDPFIIDSPVRLINDSGDPALSIENNGTGDQIGGAIAITQAGIGDVSFENAFPSVSPPPGTSAVTGGGGIPGRILSGSGSTYQVRLYPDSVAPGATVAVTQLQIAVGESVPAGTWVIVTKAGSRYVMQVPVWL